MAPFLFVSAHATSGELYVVSATDLGVKAKPGYVWRAIGAAADGQLAAVRSSPGNMILDVTLFSNCSAAGSCSGSSPYTRTLNASSTAPIIGASIADVYADGAPHLLLTYADSTMDVLWLTDGADPLYRAASFRLDPSPSAVWASVALGPWLAPPTFHTDLLLFGRPEHWLRRRASVSNVRAMQEFKTSYRDNGTNVAGLTAPLDVEAFKQVLTSVHANTYSYSVCDCGAYSTTAWNCSPLYGYEQLVRFLEATKDFKIDGQQLRVWLGLYPPSEATLRNGTHMCQPPPDSPLTPFDEHALWQGDKYTNYTRWGDLAGRLGQLYPHLVALDIDDFSSNVVTGTFDGNYVAKITSGMRARAPHMALSSVVYQTFDAFPDLALMLDAPVFFFRNAMEGAQTCAPQSCVWGPRAHQHVGSCLAGICSEPTTFNSALEIAKVVAGLPPSRSIISGYYATGHSSSGQPTARYVSRLLQTLAAQDRVSGVMTYCAKAALHACDAPPLFDEGTGAGDRLQHQLGCIVRRAYRAIAGVRTEV